MMSSITDKIVALALLAAMIWIIMAGLPGCATIRGPLGDKIDRLADQVSDVREVAHQVLSDAELNAIRAQLRSLDNIDPARLGSDDSRLWQAYQRVKSIIVAHYANLSEQPPSALKKFDATANKIHKTLPRVVRTTRDARRLIAIYKVLVM